MNKEDYVSLEVAKLLKEKKYDEPCRASILKNGELRVYDRELSMDNLIRTDVEYYEFLAPTIYEAQKWLRINNNIFVFVLPHYCCKYEIVEYEYWIATYFDLLEKPCNWEKSKEYYEKYEQCLNAGILEALKLI